MAKIFIHPNTAQPLFTHFSEIDNPFSPPPPKHKILHPKRVLFSFGKCHIQHKKSEFIAQKHTIPKSQSLLTIVYGCAVCGGGHKNSHCHKKHPAKKPPIRAKIKKFTLSSANYSQKKIQSNLQCPQLKLKRSCFISKTCRKQNHKIFARMIEQTKKVNNKTLFVAFKEHEKF